MVTNIKLLEQRIHDAVERLRDLSAERDRLAEQVRELKACLSESGNGDPVGGDERLRLAAEIRRALDELRDVPERASSRGRTP